MNPGTYIVGKLIGVAANDYEWKGKTGTNYSMGIVVGEYQDQFNQTQSITETVSVNQAQHALLEKSSLIGDQVIVPVAYRAYQGGKTGAFLKCFMPKSAMPEPVKKPLKAAS
jgi:hypothetical protein